MLENPPLKNPNINIGALKCCLAMCLSFDFMFLFTYCVCMHVCAQMYTVVYMRTPEDSVWELVLFQHLEREVIRCDSKHHYLLSHLAILIFK